MLTLDLFSVANAANVVQDQQKQKILGTILKPLQMLVIPLICFANLHKKYSISLQSCKTSQGTVAC